MTLPEAIVFLLASSNHGMKTDQIARLVNERGLYKRLDGKLVDGLYDAEHQGHIRHIGKARFAILRYQTQPVTFCNQFASLQIFARWCKSICLCPTRNPGLWPDSALPAQSQYIDYQ